MIQRGAVALTVGLALALPTAVLADEEAPEGPAVFGLLRPIRTNQPGTGVFIGSGLLARVIAERRSNEGGERLWTTRALIDFRYTPATHWVLGVRVPYYLDRSLEHPLLGESNTSGLGDLELFAKHRFFRQVGRWFDRHAALEVGVAMPTGSTDEAVDTRLPIQRRRELQPGTGSVDFSVDLVYQEGRGRLIYGGDLEYRINGADGDYDHGDAVRLNLDVEYILLPLDYRRPGREVFVLLETTLLHEGEDRFGGRSLRGTERTELLLAPGIQHVVSEQVLASLSVQVPVLVDGEAPGLEPDVNLLAEVRYAF